METAFSSRTAILATIPFWLFGLEWIFSSSGMNMEIPSFIQIFLLCVFLVPMFVLFGIGWTKDFPAWSFPALGFCPLFTLYLMSVKIPLISNDLLGLWAFVPILITLLISILFKPSLKPLKYIIKRLVDEPILVLFALYGLMPFIVWILSDEIYTLWMIPVALFSIAILSFGIYCFLRNERRRIKVLSIVLPSILSIVIVSIAASFYWN